MDVGFGDSLRVDSNETDEVHSDAILLSSS